MKPFQRTAVLILALASLPDAIRSEEEGGEPVFLSVTREAQPLSRLPSNVTVVTQDQIRASGAKTLDQVIDQLPSVDVTRTGTLGSFATVRMRGAPSSSQVQVLVDDRPLGGTSAQFIDLAQIPLDAVERVEVVRGASSVLYGANTIGGVINVITKRHAAERPRSSIGFESRSFQTRIYRADLGARGGGFDGYVNVSRYFTDGFQQNGGADNISASGNGGYSFANGGRVALDISRTDHEAGDPQGTLLPIDQWDGKKERDAADPNARAEQDITAGRLQASLPAGPLGSVKTTFYGSDQDYRTFPAVGAASSFDQNNRIAGVDAQLHAPAGFLLGAAYERDHQETESAFDPRHADHVTDWAVYAQESLRFGPLDLIPAARLDQHSAFGNAVNPRLTAVWRASDRWKLSANAARSFRAPSFLELYYKSAFFNGNPDLRPETAWGYDLGVQTRVTEKWDLGVTGFYTRLRERIAATLTTYDNAPRAETSGVEVESVARFGPFTETANYTYQRAVGSSLASARFTPLRLTPRHLANYRLDWRLPRGWTLSNMLQYVHKQFQLDDEMGVELPSYALWNARIEKKLLGAELYFAADNITNKRHAEAFGFDPVTFATTLLPQPGRTLWGGIMIRFID